MSKQNLLFLTVAVLIFISGYLAKTIVYLKNEKDDLFYVKDTSENVSTKSQLPKNIQENLNDKIILNILNRETFSGIDDKYKKPIEGNIYFSLHINVKNKSNFNLHGGGNAHSFIFQIITSDGYTINAENDPSRVWQDNRLTWNIDYLSPNENGKGWVVFSIPLDSVPKHLFFNVQSYNNPHSMSGIGRIKIPL